MKYNRISRALLFVFMGTAAVSCAKWTEPENLNFDSEVQTKPEEYYEALRAYKQSKHFVTIASVPVFAGETSIQNQHMTSYPDSLDYISLVFTDGAYPAFEEEMASVRSEKGTRFLCDINYGSINDAWIALEDAREEIEGDNFVPATEQQHKDFIKGELQKNFDFVRNYSLDGLVVTFYSVYEETFVQYFIDELKAYRAGHKSEDYMFRGYAKTIAQMAPKSTNPKEFFAEFDYIIASCGVQSEEKGINTEVGGQIYKDIVPNDRTVVQVTVPPIEDPLQIGATAEQGAEWTVIPESKGKFIKSGVFVENAHCDYFTEKGTYGHIRAAITILDTPVTEKE